MPHAANLKLCVLWEDELRKAAKLLDAAEKIYKRHGETDDYGKVASMAYAACRVALLGLEDDAQIAMVAKPELRQEPIVDDAEQST